MGDQLLSLREIGRRLGIPPSTIVYYKDRYNRYIPSSCGSGRRQKYPMEVLEIFRRIREMYGMNWTTDQIEKELSLKFSLLVDRINNDQQVINDAGLDHSSDVHAIVSSLSAVLGKISDMLANQTLFQSEIRDLRDEVAEMRKEKRSLESRLTSKIQTLALEVEKLNRDRDNLFSRLNGSHKFEDQDVSMFPDEKYLENPLVIRNSHGDYLGVLGREKRHFSLENFVDLLESSITSRRSVDINWKKGHDSWKLVIVARDNDSGEDKEIILSTRKVKTPSDNIVTQIVEMSINEKEVPQALLLSLFKQIKDSFA
jgi:vacuolar-type H+-ATPase subunit I/STV1